MHHNNTFTNTYFSVLLLPAMARMPMSPAISLQAMSHQLVITEVSVIIEVSVIEVSVQDIYNVTANEINVQLQQRPQQRTIHVLKIIHY